jgi:hypothetical protein
MATIVKAPEKYDASNDVFAIFLAGSIEMGKAILWQDEVTEKLSHLKHILILNPRRDDWDKSWQQSIDNPQFKEQVTWELDAMEDADFIFMNFDPKTQSPITLLELGLHAGDKTLVCCPEGFWRKGNVDVVCEYYNSEQVNTIDEAVAIIEEEYLDMFDE